MVGWNLQKTKKNVNRCKNRQFPPRISPVFDANVTNHLKKGYIRHGKDEENGKDERGKEIARFKFFDIQKVQADHQYESPADSSEFCEHERSHEGLQPYRRKGEHPLINENGKSREGDTWSHRACEEDGYRTVEDALCEEDAIIAFGTRFKGADYRHSSGAIQHGRVEEADREVAALISMSESVLEALAETQNGILDLDRSADQSAHDESEGECQDVAWS